MKQRCFSVFGVLEASLNVSGDMVIEKTNQTPKRTDLTGDPFGYRLQPVIQTWILSPRHDEREDLMKTKFVLPESRVF